MSEAIRRDHYTTNKKVATYGNVKTSELEALFCRIPIAARVLSFLANRDRVLAYSTCQFFRFRIMPAFREHPCYICQCNFKHFVDCCKCWQGERKSGDSVRRQMKDMTNDLKTLSFIPTPKGEHNHKRMGISKHDYMETQRTSKGYFLTKQMIHHMSKVDHHMLLDRLNTKRLYKRTLYNKKLGKSERPFPKNETTFEIACKEWNEMLHFKLPPIPPSLELLLFSSCPRAVTALASYPRSGNTLIRTMYEKCTLRITGSDMHGGLQKHDIIGEAAIGTRDVQFVKTHYPERMGITTFPASRVVLLVRNPYDALESYFNLMMTSSHTDNLAIETWQKKKMLWEEMVLKEIDVWKKFHEFWLSQDIPLLLIRYEDLIRYPKHVMSWVLQFSLNVDNMDFFNWRIDRCFGDDGVESLGSYKPRSGGIGKSSCCKR